MDASVSKTQDCGQRISTEKANIRPWLLGASVESALKIQEAVGAKALDSKSLRELSAALACARVDLGCWT
jgi:hypothetical protein